MKKITDKEYQDYQRYKNALLHGRILTPDGIRLLCESTKSPTDIGLYVLSLYEKLVSDGIFENP